MIAAMEVGAVDMAGGRPGWVAKALASLAFWLRMATDRVYSLQVPGTTQVSKVPMS